MTPWELRPWFELPQRFKVSYLLTRSNQFAPPDALSPVPVRAMRDMLPSGPLGEVLTGVIGDRYLSVDGQLADADIVHAEELSFWFSAAVARRRSQQKFKLVQTIWETLPHMVTYRNRHARRNREVVLAETDLFLPTTVRAARALELEGVDTDRIVVCPPGIDTARFKLAAAEPRSDQHTIVSPGRLVWEKGHHDVLRALAALHRGMVRLPSGEIAKPRLMIVGSGPEERRLREHASELGLAAAVDFGSVPYDQMPAVFARSSAMVLASQSSATAAYHPFDIPRAFWEEQFGMVLAEAMAAGLAIVTTTNGAIPEVLKDARADLVAPGDWLGIANALARGPLSRPAGERVEYPAEVIARYSTGGAAERLAAAYDKVLA